MISCLLGSSVVATPQIEYNDWTRPEEKHRGSYIEALTNIEDDKGGEELANSLKEIELDRLQELYLACKEIFTSKVENQSRLEIVENLKKQERSLWPTIIKQIQFVIPHGAEGKYLTWAVNLLVKVPLDKRDQFLEVANRLFTLKATVTNRVHILNALSETENLKQLDEIDGYDSTKRANFLEEILPATEENCDSFLHDEILQKGWVLTWKKV